MDSQIRFNFDCDITNEATAKPKFMNCNEEMGKNSMEHEIFLLVNVWIFMIRNVLLHHIILTQFHIATFEVSTCYVMFIEIVNLCIVEILKFKRTIVTFTIESCIDFIFFSWTNIIYIDSGDFV